MIMQEQANKKTLISKILRFQVQPSYKPKLRNALVSVSFSLCISHSLKMNKLNKEKKEEGVGMGGSRKRREKKGGRGGRRDNNNERC